jgi:hypothetical protein
VLKLIAENPVEVRLRAKVKEVVDQHGRTVMPEQPAIVAKFRRGIAPQWARDIGLARFTFTTCPEDVDPATWVAYLDTDDEAVERGWSKEEHEFADQRLKEIAGDYGYIPAERPKLEAPWPTYDRIVPQGQRTMEKVAAKIAETVAELGLDATVVAGYERENLNRPEVLLALEALVVVQEPEVDEELVSA